MIANGNWFNEMHTFIVRNLQRTVASVTDRSVKIQFSRDVTFNSIDHNRNAIDLNERLCPATSTQTVTIGVEDNATFSFSANHIQDTDPSNNSRYRLVVNLHQLLD